jgi:hypothetical protein
MNDMTAPLTADAPTAPAPSSRTPRVARSGEKTAWWIAFGVIVFAIVAMLSLWN